MQNNRTLSCPSLTKMNGSLDLVPVPTAPGCPGGRTVQDGKMRRKNSLRPLRHVCVCVCVLCHRQMHVCGVVCCVTIKQTLTLTLINASIYPYIHLSIHLSILT